MLRQLETAFVGVRGGAPHIVAFEDVHGRPVLVETAIRGLPLNPRAVRSDPDGSIRTVRNWLGRLPLTAPQPDVFDRLLSCPLHAHSERLGAHVQPLVVRTLDCTEPATGGRLPARLRARRPEPPEPPVQGDGTLGVIDWELAEPHGLPLNDLCFFLAYCRGSTRRSRVAGYPGGFFLRAFVGADAWAGHLIRDEATRQGVPDPLIEPLFISTWARDAVRYSERAGDRASPRAEGPTRTGASP